MGILLIPGVGDADTRHAMMMGSMLRLIATGCYGTTGFLTWNRVIPFHPGLICIAFTYILYLQMITDIGPLKSLTVTLLITLFGIVWRYLFLGEEINQHFISGDLVIYLLGWLIISPHCTKKTINH